jgi:hypothetical protein
MMAKRPEKMHSEKVALCHPRHPCGTCFACTSGCLLMTSLMLVMPATLAGLLVRRWHR